MWWARNECDATPCCHLTSERVLPVCENRFEHQVEGFEEGKMSRFRLRQTDYLVGISQIRLVDP